MKNKSQKKSIASSMKKKDKMVKKSKNKGIH